MCYIIQSIPAEGVMPSPASVHVHLEEAEDILDLLGPDPSALLTQIIEENDITGEKTIVKTVFSCYNQPINVRKEADTIVEKDIGAIIKAARIKNSLSQTELGMKIGYGESTAGRAIRQYESGERRPSIDKIRPLANALNLSLDDLIP